MEENDDERDKFNVGHGRAGPGALTSSLADMMCL